MPSLLHRDLRDARQWLAILNEGSCVTNHENIAMTIDVEIAFNLDASCAVGFDAKPFTGRRRRNTGSPNDRFARNPLAADFDTVRVNSIHRVSKT